VNLGLSPACNPDLGPAVVLSAPRSAFLADFQPERASNSLPGLKSKNRIKHPQKHLPIYIYIYIYIYIHIYIYIYIYIHIHTYRGMGGRYIGLVWISGNFFEKVVSKALSTKVERALETRFSHFLKEEKDKHKTQQLNNTTKNNNRPLNNAKVNIMLCCAMVE
jgi:hypothetical protein